MCIFSNSKVGYSTFLNVKCDAPINRNAGMDKLLEPPRMPKPPVPTAGGVRRSASSVAPSQAR